MVTKDSDVVDSVVLQGRPWKLLLVSTGNIANREVLHLFGANLTAIVAGLEEHAFVEITRSSVVVHF